MEVKTFSVRIPKNLWIAVRRLQEKGKVSSLNDATIKGLRMVVEKEGGK
jgi:hypothetical protein